jgi:hypothetical protein
MSEDVDLKIVCDKSPSRGALRKLRIVITDALLGAGFVFDPENEEHRVTMYEGRYTKYQLPYKPAAEGKGILRPDVQIETSVWPLMAVRSLRIRLSPIRASKLMTPKASAEPR